MGSFNHRSTSPYGHLRNVDHKPTSHIADVESANLTEKCDHCCPSSTLVAALWQRIYALEGQIIQVSAEKLRADAIFRSLRNLPTSQHGSSQASTGHTGNTSQQSCSPKQSFQTDDTLVESILTAASPKHQGSNTEDQPLIDLSESEETVRVSRFVLIIPYS